MHRERIRLVRSLSLIGATILLGISWSFAIAHVRTAAYPLFWAAAMPLLAFYYVTGSKRIGSWQHLPAAALSIYAIVLWQVTRSEGATGLSVTGLAVLCSLVAVWFGGRVSALAVAVESANGQPAPARQEARPASLGGGMPRRRRPRTAGRR